MCELAKSKERSKDLCRGLKEGDRMPGYQHTAADSLMMSFTHVTQETACQYQTIL